MDEDVKSGREYLRVSRDMSGRERSNDEQHDDNRRIWHWFGWGRSYSDAESASRYARKKRDDWEDLVRDLRQDRFPEDALVLWESSRGSRKVGEWAELLDLLEERAKKVAVTEHRRIYDPAVPRDRRTLLEDAVDSEYESAKTSRRIRRGTAANARAGMPHGRIPYGYRRVYDERTGHLVGQEPEPVEAPVVREVFERIEAGHSLRGIARDLAARGVQRRNGKPFTGGELRNMALNRLYAGERVHAPGKTTHQRLRGEGTTYSQAAWEPLVPRRRFLAVQRILSAPERRTSRSGRGKHLLSMIARCDPCGSVLAARGGGDDGTRRRYGCHGRGCVVIDADELDTLAEAAIVGYLSRPDNVAALLAGDGDDEALEAVRLEIVEIRAELDELSDNVGAGLLRPAFAARTEPLIQARLKDAEDRERELSTPSALRGLIKPGDNIAQRWAEAPVSARRTIAKLVLAPELLGELRVDRRPAGRRKVPAAERVVWLTTDGPIRAEP